MCVNSNYGPTVQPTLLLKTRYYPPFFIMYKNVYTWFVGIHFPGWERVQNKEIESAQMNGQNNSIKVQPSSISLGIFHESMKKTNFEAMGQL